MDASCSRWLCCVWGPATFLDPMSARRNPEKGWGLTLQVKPWQVLGWTAMLRGWRLCPSFKSLLLMLVLLGQDVGPYRAF